MLFLGQISHLTLLGLLVLISRNIEGAPTEVSAIAGGKASLQCILDVDGCGPIHSIKWHRGFDRIYIFSQFGNISKAEAALVGRATLRLETDKSVAALEIDPVVTKDEHLYTCDVTYLETKENCTLLQYIRLITFAIPEYVRLEYLNGTEATNDKPIGPFNEGTDISLVCSSKGGKPIPMLNWYKNGVSIKGDYNSEADKDGTGIATATIQRKLGREELGSRLECRANSTVLESPMIAWVEVNVNVRPASYEIRGYNSPVLEDSILTLLCEVKGARPAANITWYNGTEVLTHQPPSSIGVEAGGTFETLSRLTFSVSRYDNGIKLGCETTNLVLEEMGGPSYLTKKQIEVHYKPVVTISPKNITVNESSDLYLTCEDDSNPSEKSSVKWYQNGELLHVNDPFHFEGGTVKDPNLLIKNVTEVHLGNYTCALENIVGESLSDGFANVNVLYRATVQVSIEPLDAVREEDETNVTLRCDVLSGNPEVLDAVSWYFGNKMIDLPAICSNTSEECDDDPVKLILKNVSRNLHGDYHCRAKNEAGWGERSRPTTVEVYYVPGRPIVKFEPLISVKGQILYLYCVVDDPGRPPVTHFRWWRGNELEVNQTSANWTISQISVEHRANYSCEAVNEAGVSAPGSVLIDVFAPPEFIASLSPEHGVSWNSTEVKLTCQVECRPSCKIDWFKNGISINSRDHLYITKYINMRADPTKNQFESYVSMLSWSLEKASKAGRGIGNDNYTCKSTGNDYGLGVTSTTQLRIEYPPDTITISTPVLNVTENDYPEAVTCVANGSPEPDYIWKFGEHVVSDKNVLQLNHSLKRTHAGEYECIAQNSLGEISEKLTLDVQYAPECKIEFEDIEDDKILVCSAKGNPTTAEFRWFLGEKSYETHEKVDDVKSKVKFNPSREYVGTYRCEAHNSVGAQSCNFTIPGSWLQLVDDAGSSLLMFALVVIAVILLFLIICIILILACRRKRTNEKHLSPTPNRGDPSDDGKAYYENLPFHGLQNSEATPYRPTTMDLEYADKDYRQLYVYGPMDYKAASLLAATESNANNSNTLKSQRQVSVESEIL